MRYASSLLASLAAAYGPVRGDRRPALMLDQTSIGGHSVAIAQRRLVDRPFCRLIHLDRDIHRDDPRLLVVAPLSGHFSALLRDVLAALVLDHDVYVTDWVDARDVPVECGDFGVGDNISYVLDFIRQLGGSLHLLGLCQSAMPALAATALLAQHNDLTQPRSITLINGMLDTRITPTRIDRLARSHSSEWFRRNTISPVPMGYPGKRRLVYPAAIQHAGLMAYLARHLASGEELLGKVLHDDGEVAAKQPFLELYLSVMDLPATFFLDMIRLVFHEFALPRSQLFWRGERVELAAIAGTGLLTVEGEHDDVSGRGQTYVAHELCRNISRERRMHYLQRGVGHFGTFYGRVWRTEVMPRLRAFIRAMN